MFYSRRFVPFLVFAGFIVPCLTAHAAPVAPADGMRITLYQSGKVIAVVNVVRGSHLTVHATASQVTHKDSGNTTLVRFSGGVSITVISAGKSTPVKLTADEALIETAKPGATPPSTETPPPPAAHEN